MKGKRNRFLTLFMYLKHISILFLFQQISMIMYIYLNDVEGGGETGFLKYSDLSRFKAEKYLFYILG